MTEPERVVLAPQVRAQPVDVEITAVEVRQTSNGTELWLTYDTPLIDNGDIPHQHVIPMAALADRAVKYGLDPRDPDFVADVLTYLINEINHPVAHANQGVAPNLDRADSHYGFDRPSLRTVESHVDLDWVLQHTEDLYKAQATVLLPPHLWPNRTNAG